MTDDRIRELAEQASDLKLHPLGLLDNIERAIRTALTEQREEDARVCESLRTGVKHKDDAREQCAAAIRGNASAESEGKP